MLGELYPAPLRSQVFLSIKEAKQYLEPPNVIFLFILKKGMGESNVVVLHILVTCAKSYGCAYGPTCAYGPDGGGGGT